MKEFFSYAEGLERLALVQLSNPLEQVSKWNRETSHALNGGPSQVLRKLIPIHILKDAGTFFTGQSLRDLLGGIDLPSSDSIVIDPACGVGDLLLSASKSLPVFGTLEETLSHWGGNLYGFDLYPAFVHAARSRLVLEAVRRNPEAKGMRINNLELFFPNIRVGDGLVDSSDSLSRASHILLNPPFFRVKGADFSWGKGSISAAAVFVDYCVKSARSGALISAILPDVLRSGSLYKRWRGMVEESASIEGVEIFGQFDSKTDVSVFLLRLAVGIDKPSSNQWWDQNSCATKTFSEFCDIRVGSVVPYRDPEVGNEYAYLQPKGLRTWATIGKIDERRRFTGRTVLPPFVVVRRNSRFEDAYRATATIVDGSEPIAVENHLIVIKPNDNRLKTCRAILQMLKSDETNRWLNSRIRCRHLTTSSLKALPWTI